MGIKSKDKKTNSRQHRKDVKKDIKKRVKKVSKANREAVGDISYGSRVVQRTRADVSRAPAYKPEKIKSGGYHSTFPSGQGVLDNQMQLQRMIERGLNQQKNQNQFKMLIDQGMAGNINMDEVSNELKQQISQQYANLENEKEKAKLLKELKKVSADTDKVRNEGLNYARVNDKSLISRSKNGPEKIIRKKELMRHLDRKKAEFHTVEESTKAVKEIRKTAEAHQNAKQQLDFEKKRVRDLFESEHNDDAVKAIDANDMVQLKVIKNNFERENKTFDERIKAFRSHGDALEKFIADKRQMQIVRDEIDLMGDKTGHLTQKLARLESMYGHDQELLNQKIKEESEKVIEQGKLIRDTTTNLRRYEDFVKEFGTDYHGKYVETMRKAQNVIAADPYVDWHTRDLADLRMLNMKEINGVLGAMQRRRYDAHKVYAKVLNEIDTKITNPDASMADWNAEFRQKLRELMKPTVEHYQNLDEDFDDEVVEKEKSRVSRDITSKLIELTHMTPEELWEERVNKREITPEMPLELQPPSLYREFREDQV